MADDLIGDTSVSSASTASTSVVWPAVGSNRQQQHQQLQRRELQPPQPRGDTLHLAASRGKVYRVGACLAKGHDPNGLDSLGHTPLYIACVHGHLACAKALLHGGAQVNMCTSKGISPVDAAVEGGHTGLLRELVWAGADLTSLDFRGYPLMLRIAGEGHAVAVRELLSAGVEMVDVVGERSGKTALILASRGGHLEVVQGLLGAGANVSRGDRRGWTSLHFAAWKGHLGELLCTCFFSGLNLEVGNSGRCFEKCNYSRTDTANGTDNRPYITYSREHNVANI